MNHLPSYAEFAGFYNVNLEDHQDQGSLPPYPNDQYYRTAKRLPPLTPAEFEDIRGAMYHCLESYARPPGLNQKEASTFYRFCVRDELIDRTVAVELPDIRILTPRLVDVLQREILYARPLWRILIAGEVPETVILIYPTVVRCGTAKPAPNWQQALAAVVEEEWNRREPREGPRRRQCDYVGRGLQHMLQELSARDPMRFLAAFDNRRGDYQMLAVWLVHRGESWSDIRLIRPEDAMRGEYFAVKADGTFGTHYAPDSAEYWLTEWLIPAGFHGSLIAQKTDSLSHTISELTIALRPESIISDVGPETILDARNHRTR
jgi:hypothetical protein